MSDAQEEAVQALQSSQAMGIALALALLLFIAGARRRLCVWGGPWWWGRHL